MAEEKNQVNVDFSKYPELHKALVKMVQDDDTDVSKFIRKLVREEVGRRAQLPLPFPTTESKQKKSAAESVVA